MAKYPRLTLIQGASISIAGLVSGLVAWDATFLPLRLSLRIILLLYAWFCLWFFSHGLTHHIVGRLGGIKFQYYFLGRSAITKLKLPVVCGILKQIPVLVLKVDRKTAAQASTGARRRMYASGALASMILPWLVIPSSYTIGPIWVGYFFTLLVVGNDVFTLYFSPKTGDLYRARNVKS